ETTERLLARPILEHPLDRKAERVVDASVVLTDRDHGAARFLEKPRADAADVAEALHRNLRLMRLAAEMLQRSERADGDAASGGLDPAKRTAHLDRLAGHRRRHRVTEMHRKRIHDPGHRLAVGINVRRGDVAVRADENRDLGRESPRHVLELVEWELLRVDDYSALGAAERDIDDRALPGHPHRERLDLVEGDVGGVGA